MVPSNDLSALLRDRFAEHSMDAPPGAWEHITGQLQVAAAAPDDGSGLRDLLQNRFEGHLPEVDPSVWAAVQSGIGASAAPGVATSTWLFGAAGAAGAAVVVVGAVWLAQGSSEAPQPDVAAVSTPLPSNTTEHAAPHAEWPTGPEVEPNVTPPMVPPQQEAVEDAPKQPRPAPVQQLPTDDAEGLARVEAILRALEAQPRYEDPVATPGAATSPKLASGTQNTSQQPEQIPSTVLEGMPASTEANEAARTVEELSVFIPNVFSPNGDGHNDVHQVVAHGFTSARIHIYSARTNALVFSTEDLDVHWNGLLPDGQMAEPGMYFCAMELVDHHGRTHAKGEVLHLVR